MKRPQDQEGYVTTCGIGKLSFEVFPNQKSKDLASGHYCVMNRFPPTQTDRQTDRQAGRQTEYCSGTEMGHRRNRPLGIDQTHRSGTIHMGWCIGLSVVFKAYTIESVCPRIACGRWCDCKSFADLIFGETQKPLSAGLF